MGVKRFSNARIQYDDGNGALANGYRMFWYAAGSSTKQNTYNSSTGVTPNSNPITLNALGEPATEIWLTTGLNYKLLFAPPGSDDPPSSPVWTEDVISGVNDNSNIPDQWVDPGLTPTYVNATSFTFAGDQTTIFHVGRRVKCSVTAGTVYGRITVSAFTTLTTITLVLDSGNLDSGLTSVFYGIAGAVNQSIDVLAVTRAVQQGMIFLITPAETAASVTPTSYLYPPGDLRRYGADITGVADSASAMNSALLCKGGGTGGVFHPGGTIKLDSRIIVPNGVTIYGTDRFSCIFNATHILSAFENNNGPNSSGFGRVNFRNLQITTNNASNVNAAIELNAGGFSYYEITDCQLSNFKYGIILDGTEVSHVRGNLIATNSAANCAGIWIVNGPDRSSLQGTGFTNNIHIYNNQIDGTGTGSIGIADDGGGSHWITNNNINGFGISIRCCGLQSAFDISGNEMENAGFTDNIANILFTDTTWRGTVNVGGCFGGKITANAFAADMSSGSSLAFGGASMHYGIHISGNFFRFNSGRIADIDVTKLGNSYCGENNIAVVAASGEHYAGVHNDANGNTLKPPQNGYGGGFVQGAVVYGDNRFPYVFYGPVVQPRKTVTYSAAMSVDVSTGTYFEITATNNTAFTITATTPAADPFYDGQRITVIIINSAGGALGPVTWNTIFRMSAWTQPANGFSRSIDFQYNVSTGKFRQISQTGVDVPN